MNNITFQLVLRETVFPEHFILEKLKELIEPRQVEIGDFDLEYIRGIIKINYYTEYPNLKRQVLCFTIDLSIVEPLGKSAIKEMILEFGKSLMQCEQVEGVFRFEDYLVLSEIIKLHEEIYDIEQKVREILSYILSYNFSENGLFDFIKEFEGPKFANSRIRSDSNFRENLWSEFMENELFYISFTEYGYFNKPKPLESKSIFDLISRASDFNMLKEKINNRGISTEINENHLAFISDLSTNLNPIESVRNEIMHNRIVKEGGKLQQITSFYKAKEQLLKLISDFWKKEEEKTVNKDKQIRYVINYILSSATNENGSYKYIDLNFEEQVAEDKEEFRMQILEIITNYFPENNLNLNSIMI